MHPIDFIRDVETTYDVASITVDGVQVWPFLRQVYFNHVRGLKLAGALGQKKNMFKELGRVRNVFHGLKHWWGKHDYILFTSTERRKRAGGKNIEKNAEWILRTLGKKRTLVIQNPEAPAGSDFQRGTNVDEEMVSCDLFNMCMMAPRCFSKIFVIQNEQILKEINVRYDVDVNYQWVISAFFRMASIMECFYRRWKPKAIFISGYYGIIHQAALYAAHQRGITTIETQHGVINETRAAYNVFCRLDRDCFPDYFLTFGRYFLRYFHTDNYFMPKDHVIPVGNGYIEYIHTTYELPGHLQDIIRSYKRSVAVSSIMLFEEEIIDFLKKAADKDPGILYVFIPRLKQQDYSQVEATFPDNIKVFHGFEFYEIVKYTDFHMTVSSTCALEAPALGTPNILIDLHGLARKLSQTLSNREVTQVVDTPEELVKKIQDWCPKAADEIMQMYDEFYEPHHLDNIKKALGKILG